MIVKEIKVYLDIRNQTLESLHKECQGRQLKNKHKLQDLVLTMEIKDKIVNLLRVLEIKTLLLFSTI